MYPPDAPYKIYDHDEWWSDNWDAKTFGRDFDFSRPFFAQFQELLFAVPRFALMNTNSERCEYSNITNGSKDCYLIFGCVDDEECDYGHIVWESKDCVDNLYIYKSELCYECVDCLGSYKLIHSQECENCVESIGLFDCRSCTNCIGCVGLKQKSNCLFNEEVGKEGIEKFLAEHPLTDPSTISLILSKQKELRKRVPQRHFFGSHNKNVSGNHIYFSNNVLNSFDVKVGENSKFVFTGRKTVDVYDSSFSINIELGYQILTCRGNNIMLSHLCSDSSDTMYSDNCVNSHNIFGCAGLKNGEYCILNKQYPKEEYFGLKEKIISHMKQTREWSEFFPKELSPFAYNEAIVNEYMPLTKEEAISKGYKWRDDIPFSTGQETIKYSELPTDPKNFSADLLKQVLKCESCTRNYRLIDREVNFYKNTGLLIPSMCFNCRHARRMGLRNKRYLWPGKCAHCGADFETSYGPEEQKNLNIFCEKCYLEEMG
jgi:hypothetical protein